jgi:phage recombination protein Bet
MNEIVKYQAGAKEIELTPSVIRNYLVAGNGKVTDSEVMMFMKMCEFQGLNPFLREAYLVKYGNDYPATMITGKETFVKRASRNPYYKGHKVGMSEDAKSAWAEVYHSKLDFPIRVEVDYNEYVGLKNGKPNKMWDSKPKTMLKKVALVQALRETFPEEFGGLYSPEEVHDVDEAALPTDEVIIDAEDVKQLNHTETGVQQAASKEKTDKTDKTEASETSELSEIPDETPVEKEAPPSILKENDTAFIKVKKVTKKKNSNDKIQFFIFSVGETMYSTFDAKVATAADKIKGTETEALIAYDIVHVGDNTYFNVSKGEVDAVFIVQ